MHRVVVTGLGAMTPLGLGYEQFWANLRQGVSGVDRISRFDTRDLDVHIAAEVRDFDARDHMGAKAARHMDRFAQLAVAAAGQALRDADLTITPERRYSVGVMLNTGGGGMHTLACETIDLPHRRPGARQPVHHRDGRRPTWQPARSPSPTALRGQCWPRRPPAHQACKRLWTPIGCSAWVKWM